MSTKKMELTLKVVVEVPIEESPEDQKITDEYYQINVTEDVARNNGVISVDCTEMKEVPGVKSDNDDVSQISGQEGKVR